MIEHAVTAEGIETCGTLTPWSDIRSIVLTWEPPVILNDVTVAHGYRQIVVEQMNGDFFEIAEDDPSWLRVIGQLPVHRTLVVHDLAALITSDLPEDTPLSRLRPRCPKPPHLNGK